jgi:hypothetical protein
MSVYAFDGTWNEAKDGDDPAYTNTNVFRFYDAYKRHSKRPDLDFYVPGVGTRFKAIGRALGGVFGLGELPRINEAYEALCKAWDQGERDIDIVGFSRGAATTLDFWHCIQERGIRRPGSDDVVDPHRRFGFSVSGGIVRAYQSRQHCAEHRAPSLAAEVKPAVLLSRAGGRRASAIVPPDPGRGRVRGLVPRRPLRYWGRQPEPGPQ